VHSVQAGETLAAIAQAYGVTVNSIVEANAIDDPNAIHVGQRLLIPDPSRVPTSSAGGTVGSRPDVPVAATPTGALTWLPDTDPGPPFSVEVSLNRATQDLLVEQSRNYKVTGLVRNDGEQTYAVSAIHVTFYDASGFRGVFQKAPGRGRTGGEWIWHGRTEADFGCLLLAPGEACPFSVEITAQDMASFLIHPDAVVVVREDGTDYLRITGTATNASLFKVKQVTVSGVLLDRSDQIVSVGLTYALGEGIEPGESVPFDLRVEKEPYTSYQLYAQAERDWD
jgi:LysM repeat protein